MAVRRGSTRFVVGLAAVVALVVASDSDLPLGYLAPETIVRVPYDPTGECGEAVATPPGSPRQFGTPPAGR